MRWEDSPRERRTVRITGQPTPARRRSVTTAQISSRPDRVALWAVMLGLFLVLMAAATARAGWSHATLGERAISKGDRGSDVLTLQRVLRMKRYRIAVDGVFGRGTKRTVKRFQRRRRLQADGVVGPLTTRALATTWRASSATIFGPGLYGNRTACGHTLAHRTRGLAHRQLGCGRRVAVYHSGRVVVLPVIDRGPFTDGIAFDVTEAAGRKLGMRSTTTIRAGY
jgi:rare lipoprotein A (peptidoglycan hydrolase)